jgi:SAM-dependent methyltransferase
MDGRQAIRKYFELQMLYKSLFEGYCNRGVSTTIDRNDKEFGNRETLDHYFSVGADALRLIVDALLSNLREPPRLILDFPSGSGRVTRHLRSFFPHAAIVACDLYENHVEFCKNNFATGGVISCENLKELQFDDQFDLIFCGSLLTHFPADLFEAGLGLISRSLSPSGMALITLHGRHSTHFQRHRFRYIEDNRFDVIESTLAEEGFGFVDYNHEFKAAFNKQGRYGISVSFPHWTLRLLKSDHSVRILGYAERAWDDHHDVLIVGKPGINES